MLMDPNDWYEYDDYLEDVSGEPYVMFKFINAEKCPLEYKNHLREWDRAEYELRGVHPIINWEELYE